MVHALPVVSSADLGLLKVDVNHSGSRIIIALDYPDTTPALALAQRLDPGLCRLKVGSELFVRSGPRLIEKLQNYGFEVFLDLKFHDIPRTVAAACKAAQELGVWMCNVHVLGGRKMLEAAREAVATSPRGPLLIAVTVLTSLAADDLQALGMSADVDRQVVRGARMAQAAEFDGVVCSAQEAQLLRAAMGPLFCLVTPGIRPEGSAADDQSRIMTPRAAMQAGADFLVIGRPVTQAANPLEALQAISASLGCIPGDGGLS